MGLLDQAEAVRWHGGEDNVEVAAAGSVLRMAEV